VQLAVCAAAFQCIEQAETILDEDGFLTCLATHCGLEMQTIIAGTGSKECLTCLVMQGVLDVSLLVDVYGSLTLTF